MSVIVLKNIFDKFTNFNFTYDQLLASKKSTKLSITCVHCGNKYTKPVEAIIKQLKAIEQQDRVNKRERELTLCSTKCKQETDPRHIIVETTCGFCHKPITRTQHQLNISKTGLVFCDAKCSRSYYSQQGITKSTYDWSWLETDDNPAFKFTLEDVLKANTPQTATSKLLDCICQQCGKSFKISVSNLYEYRAGKSVCRYCSVSCGNKARKKQTLIKINVPCFYCGKPLERMYDTETKLYLSKSGQYKDRAFCNVQCGTRYLNEHNLITQKGRGRPKVETYIESCIKAIFPNLPFIACDRAMLAPYELDFYFPSINCGLEVNGLFHYQPCVGHDDLSRYTALKKRLQSDLIKSEMAKQLNMEIGYVNCSEVTTVWFRRLKTIIKPVLQWLAEKQNIPTNWKQWDQIEMQVEQQLQDSLFTMNDKQRYNKICTEPFDNIHSLYFEDQQTTIEFQTKQLKVVEQFLESH